MFKAKYLKYPHGQDPERYLSLSTDSRCYTDEDIFWCLNGPSFKGSDYIDSVFEKGCRIFVLEGKYDTPSLRKRFPRGIFLSAKDSFIGLRELASSVIRGEKKEGLRVIGITGSNGKTTTKEMVKFILERLVGSEYVSSTRGNFNNLVGVPLTILSMQKKTKWLILEMGTNRPGEIAQLAQIGMPDIGIITNIGEAHLEYLCDRRGVLEEKRTLYDYIEKHSSIPLGVIDRDDEMLRSLDYPFTVTFSRRRAGDYEYRIGSGNTISVGGLRKITIVNTHIREEFNLVNLLQSVLLLVHALPEKADEIVEVAGSVVLAQNNRCTWKTYGKTRVYLDAYNANPSSMRASLSGFGKAVSGVPKDKVLVVLGDMNELGGMAQGLHKEIGRLTRVLGFKNVYFVGRYSQFYWQGREGGKAVGELEVFRGRWDEIAPLYDYVFLKGSRALQLESLLDTL